MEEIRSLSLIPNSASRLQILQHSQDCGSVNAKLDELRDSSLVPCILPGHIPKDTLGVLIGGS